MPPEAMHSRFTSAGESPGFLLWRISNAWQQRQRAALLPLGLTHVQFVLLASLVWLTQHGRTVTQTDLAEQAQTDPMMTSQVVRALEARGLLTRETSAQDRRARVRRGPEPYDLRTHADAPVVTVGRLVREGDVENHEGCALPVSSDILQQSSD